MFFKTTFDCWNYATASVALINFNCLPKGRHSKGPHDRRLLCAQKYTRGGVGWVMLGWVGYIIQGCGRVGCGGSCRHGMGWVGWVGSCRSGAATTDLANTNILQMSQRANRQIYHFTECNIGVLIIITESCLKAAFCITLHQVDGSQNHLNLRERKMLLNKILLLQNSLVHVQHKTPLMNFENSRSPCCASMFFVI